MHFFVSESQVTKCGFARVRCIFGMARHFLAAKRMGKSIFGSTKRERGEKADWHAMQTRQTD